ncbi:homoserine O-acetyltransferase/O-succinyltransferase family protein [Muribaculum gordoncarteri]|uniref:homoserine O-acetyltransferase/O-succinyltransferase family protein n=1 Tax=Muribaculum gordoncarteri TaxID=2530390 RepID=UPI003F678863
MTETDLLRLISNTPLQIELDLIDTCTHVSRNTPREHIEEFYKTFEDIINQNYDGFIITGAPVEKVDFEEVDYWTSCARFLTGRTHVTSTLYICWPHLPASIITTGCPSGFSTTRYRECSVTSLTTTAIRYSRI